MKKEISAGGVVVRKKQGVWEVLLIRDMAGNWTFPKGIIEDGETPQQGAVREVREEVGLSRLARIASLDRVHYTYRRGSLIRKTVHYFLYSVADGSALHIQKEEGITDARWVPMTDAPSVIGYPDTNRALLTRAKSALKKKQIPAVAL